MWNVFVGGCYEPFNIPFVPQSEARGICQAVINFVVFLTNYIFQQGYKKAGALVSIHDPEKELFVNSGEIKWRKKWI